jgi:hypothetical protein
VFLRRVANHFNQAGWTVESEAVLESADGAFKPDLVITKGHVRKAVLVRSEEPPGPYEIAKFGARCRQAKVKGLIVAPDDPSVEELYVQASLEFVPGESIGEVIVVGKAPSPRPLPIDVARPTEAPVPADLGPVARLPLHRPSPWWRWAIVALIWLAALAAIAYDVYLYTMR